MTSYISISMSATTVPATVSGSSSHTQQVSGKEQNASGHTRSSRKREKSHSANGHNQTEPEPILQGDSSSEAKKAKTVMPSSPSAGKPSIHDIFKTLEYGPAPEAPNVAEAWLDDHKRCSPPPPFSLYLLLTCPARSFGHFINGKWYMPEGKRNTYESRNSVNGSRLATTLQGTTEDVDIAIQAARTAYVSWSNLPPHVRARLATNLLCAYRNSGFIYRSVAYG